MKELMIAVAAALIGAAAGSLLTYELSRKQTHEEKLNQAEIEQIGNLEKAIAAVRRDRTQIAQDTGMPAYQVAFYDDANQFAEHLYIDNAAIDNVPRLDPSLKFDVKALRSTLYTIEHFYFGHPEFRQTNPYQFLYYDFLIGVDDDLLALLKSVQ